MIRQIANKTIRYSYVKDFKKPIVESTAIFIKCHQANLQSISTNSNIIQMPGLPPEWGTQTMYTIMISKIKPPQISNSSNSSILVLIEDILVKLGKSQELWHQ